MPTFERDGLLRIVPLYPEGASLDDHLVEIKASIALVTAATPSLFGGSSITEGHISTLTDSIILLRYVETKGAVLRGITVPKMRGSLHDDEIHRFAIAGDGMRIGEPFRSIGGILTGNIVNLRAAQLDSR